MSLHLANINFTYPGGQAPTLSGVELHIGAGECVALMGASGCGKSTLFGIAAGFLRPESGRVLLNGRDVTALPPEARGLGLVPQHYALFPTKNARDNVAYPLILRGMTRAEAAREALSALTAVGLDAMADRRPAALSGGQRQRVALARATVFAPPALLLDEPLSALDPHLRRELGGDLRQIQRASGAACLIVTHDADEAFALGDRIAVMEAGRIIQLDTPEAIYANPATLSTARLTGPVNLISGVVATDGTLETTWGRITLPDSAQTRVGDCLAVLIRPERLLRWPSSKGFASVTVLSVVGRESRRQGGSFVHELLIGDSPLLLVDADPVMPTMVAIPTEALVIVPAT